MKIVYNVGIDTGDEAIKGFTEKTIGRIGERLRGRPARHGAGGPRGLGLWWTFAAGLVLAPAAIVAIVQNSGQVRLHFLVWHATVSLIVVVLTTALTAVFLAEVGGLVWRRRRRSRLGRRSELETLRGQHQPAREDPPAAVSASLR
jgi:uncharacterized integral membrane protein